MSTLWDKKNALHTHCLSCLTTWCIFIPWIFQKLIIFWNECFISFVKIGILKLNLKITAMHNNLPLPSKSHFFKIIFSFSMLFFLLAEWKKNFNSWFENAFLFLIKNLLTSNINEIFSHLSKIKINVYWKANFNLNVFLKADLYNSLKYFLVD